MLAIKKCAKDTKFTLKNSFKKPSVLLEKSIRKVEKTNTQNNDNLITFENQKTEVESKKPITVSISELKPQQFRNSCCYISSPSR
ncbi:MAG: hypothetical protein R2822_30990 [Spirosomataceae bacterium]